MGSSERRGRGAAAPGAAARPGRVVRRAFGALALVGLAAAAWAAAPPRPGPGEADEFKSFEADLGPAWIDVSVYPPEQQQRYALFSRKCSKCHTLARPINSAMRGDEWRSYVHRMSRKPGSGISPKDAEGVLEFLIFDSGRRTRSAGAVDPELVPFLRVTEELTGVRRFPASKRDIRGDDGPLKLALEADPRLDLSRFVATDDGQKLLRWTRRDPHRGELVVAASPAAAGPRADPVPPTRDAALLEAVAAAVGSAREPVERVERILDWLDETVKREYRKGTAAPAAILAEPRGDATEFARLFVAMARAAGIPARTRVGLVARRTAFYFHAWAEVWLSGWTAVDPYLGQLPADPTHVRLATPGDDALAGWDAARPPGLDRLQIRVVSDAAAGEE